MGAVLAAAAGVIDFLYTVPPESSAKNRGLLHGGLNSLVLLLFIYVAYRLGSPSAAPDGATLLLMGIGVVILAISGWLGGTLVYRNQIGIDRRYASAGKLKTRTIESWSKPVCNQSELGDGQVLLATVGTERVVVGRCSEGLFAFSDHCTHRGGPLSDGALVGCTVQCPWHGSQFDVRTGRVVAGPAQEKIKVYSIKIFRWRGVCAATGADGSETAEGSVVLVFYDGTFCGGAGGGLSPMPLISRIVSRITSPLIFKLSTLNLSTVS